MSSEEKAPNGNPDNIPSDSDVEPVEAEFADSPPVAEPAVDLKAEEPILSAVAGGPTDASDANVAEVDKTGITRFFEDRGEIPENASLVVATAVGKIPEDLKPHQSPPALATNLQNLSANGGAIGALVLGVWCFLGSFITNWSIINGLLGLLLGAWGLMSRRKKSAWIGIVLCTAGILLCLAEFSELINQWWYEVDGTLE